MLSKFNWRKINLPLVLIIFVYILLILKYSSFVPMWDAWEYTNTWIYKAITSPFNLFNFDAAGHPSFVYFFLISFLQYFGWGNQFFLYISNGILTIISIVAFYQLIKSIYPDGKLEVERLLITTLYAFYPIMIANVFNINLDYGVVIFFVITLSFIIRYKIRLAAFSALGLVFSKETGILLYLLLLLGYLIFQKKNKLPLSDLYKFIPKNWILLLPIILFLIRIGIKLFWLKQPALWFNFNEMQNPLVVPFDPNILARIPYSYFLLIFVINFNWLLTFFSLIGLVKFFSSKILGYKTGINLIDQRRYIFVIYTSIGAIVILTLFKTFSNPRYFLPIYPLLIISASVGINSFLSNQLLRKIFIGGLVLIFLVSNFKTIDPITKKIYGTFKFGRHEMLNMTSITGECCGYGRDQIVYNLQFTNIHFLLDKILSDIRPNEETAIAYTHWIGPHVIERLDKTTGKRTLRRDNSFQPSLVIWNFYSLPQRPDIIYFIEFPNTDRRPNLDDWLYFYDEDEVKIYEQMGYRMKVYRLKLKT